MKCLTGILLAFNIILFMCDTICLLSYKKTRDLPLSRPNICTHTHQLLLKRIPTGQVDRPEDFLERRADLFVEVVRTVDLLRTGEVGFFDSFVLRTSSACKHELDAVTDQDSLAGTLLHLACEKQVRAVLL